MQRLSCLLIRLQPFFIDIFYPSVTGQPADNLSLRGHPGTLIKTLPLCDVEACPLIKIPNASLDFAFAISFFFIKLFNTNSI